MERKDNGAGQSGERKIHALLLGVVILAVFIIYGIQLFSLQIVKGLEYKRRATQVSRRVIPIPSQRGEIYDRNADVPLVLNIDSYAVDIVPAEVSAADLPALLERIAAVVDVPVESMQQRLTPETMHLFQPVEVVDKISIERIYYIAEHIDMFPGVTWHNKPIRSYLESGSITHVLGYVNDIDTEELQILYNQGYKMGDIIGKRGIEKQYDAMLRGRDGAMYKTVDATGRRVGGTEEDRIEPQNGYDIVLTIDRNIQDLAEKALGDRIGSVVVLKPATGEILAMVSYPWYDPNQFYRDRSGEVFDKLSLDTRSPLLNRAIQSAYAPASAFKILVTTALLEEEAVDPEMTVDCTGEMWVGNKIVKCWKKFGHGEVNLKDALAQSCNIYFGTVGRKYLGIERLADYMHRFGLGQRTMVDLPGERRGISPSPEWKEKNRGQVWVGGDTVNISIGQGFTTVTPLQMANVVAMIANKGVVYQPHLLKEVRDPITGETVESIPPRILHSSSIRTETFERVQAAMRHVVTDGTAEVVITTEAVDIAGKTGTGEVGLEEQWNSWFVAFAPYGAEPEDMVVVVVLVEAVNEWEWWAPKAANVIFQGIFADQNYLEAVDELSLWYLP